jgi:hypothetical protein
MTSYLCEYLSDAARFVNKEKTLALTLLDKTSSVSQDAETL